MAFLGGLGKALGFGSTQNVVTGFTGSPFVGAVAGQAAKGLSNLQRSQMTQQGQATAVSIPDAPARAAKWVSPPARQFMRPHLWQAHNLLRFLEQRQPFHKWEAFNKLLFLQSLAAAFS